MIFAGRKRTQSFSLNLRSGSRNFRTFRVISRFDNRLGFDRDSLLIVQEARLAPSLSLVEGTEAETAAKGREQNDRARSRCTGNVGSDSGSRAT